MSKSNSEELIGILWLILTMLLVQNNISGWWIATLILGIISQIASIVYSIKQRLEQKIAQMKEQEDEQ